MSDMPDRDFSLEQEIFIQNERLAEMLSFEMKPKITGAAQTLMFHLAQDDELDPYRLAQQQVQSQFDQLSEDQVHVLSFYVLSEVTRLLSVPEELREKSDTLGELSQEMSERLQMYMDRKSKLMQTLSNLLQEITDTASAILQNMK